MSILSAIGQTRWGERALGLIVASVLFSSLGRADTNFDVSKVIDKATAESVLGESVKAPTPRNVQGKDGYYSKCNYYTVAPGKSLIIRVYQAAEGFNPYKELEQVIESSGAMRAISGVGDKARLSAGPESGLSPGVAMLYVVKANALVTVGLSGITDETAAQEKVIDTAKKILATL
jgi:hypothetical protein